MALIAGVIASYLLVRSNTASEDAEVTTTDQHDGYYMRAAVIRGIGADGRFLYALAADEITEDPDTGDAALRAVSLEYAASENIAWTLEAQSGRVSEDGTSVRLQGNVQARARIDGMDTTLTTPSLEFLPQSYALKSDERITLQIGERTISATGMLAFLNEDRIEFQSNVSGKFLP